MTKVTTTVIWKHDPDAHDYPAARTTLALIASPQRVDSMVARPSEGTGRDEEGEGPAACRFVSPSWPDNNAHVAADLGKVHKGQPLSPVLVIQGTWSRGSRRRSQTDTNRICASYHVDENTEIPCRIVAWDD